MSWSAVHRWLERLRAIDPAQLDSGLSAEGARAAWAASLDALTDLDRVAALGGRPYRTASFIAASTVFTAPIEWLAVLLGRGSHVMLKAPSARPGAAPMLAQTAAAEGLPLQLVSARDPALLADLIVAMGSDASMSAIRAAAPPAAKLLLHGHRFSVAWVAGSDWDGVARDIALHDSRGCLSPSVVFTPQPLERAVAGLAAAMGRAQAELPVGQVGDGEGARIRSRGALARVTGVEASGPGFSVHGLPAHLWRPTALPRSAAIVSVAGPDEAAAVLAPWLRWLSTIGTDEPGTAAVIGPEARVVALGHMQAPPLLRQHDGRDWLVETGVDVRPWR